MTEKFIVPFSGELLSLEQVPDVHFSQKQLGEGFAIKLTGEQVISPFDGVVIAAFPTGHAFIIRRKDGLEVLIHLGLNSANKPEAFQMKVEKYQKVKQGDVLVQVDKTLLAIRSDEDLISPIVFSNPNIKVQLHKQNQNVVLGDEQAITFAIN
ncbi:NagE protein [Gallibacterium salpingitidis]|uniref:PTS system glucose-specific EIIA component n=1 Tax=Gallibacterium salpingitidis TaxID=505341 RepID=A0A1A7Q718_9PAST|nr:PTS glucose transporter subunit IIA [Gallibacterium salpingitidis]OBW95965.1 NagE protein [Gallibacterium salpingitidis]OBX09255.1 NagE protein [Gallibacterium salpingitidis]OBX10653.1 NagE protein [Gallibacterium salpingitidis]WKT00226.1 PTS glucose transporter subunit IIA [Gallibacterium salpingitidis]